MTAATRKIEIDEATASVLEARAEEKGVSVGQLIAELALADSELLPLAADQLAEFDRRWQAIEAGEATVPHEEVVRWLETWGTPAFRPWPKR